MWVELNDEQSHPIQRAVVAHQKENGNLMSRDRLKTVAREEKNTLLYTQRFTLIAIFYELEQKGKECLRIFLKTWNKFSPDSKLIVFTYNRFII